MKTTNKDKRALVKKRMTGSGNFKTLSLKQVKWALNGQGLCLDGVLSFLGYC